MDWFLRLMDSVVVAGQVSACLYLAYGAWLCLSRAGPSSIAAHRVALKPIEVSG